MHPSHNGSHPVALCTKVTCSCLIQLVELNSYNVSTIYQPSCLVPSSDLLQITVLPLTHTGNKYSHSRPLNQIHPAHDHQRFHLAHMSTEHSYVHMHVGVMQATVDTTDSRMLAINSNKSVTQGSHTDLVYSTLSLSSSMSSGLISLSLKSKRLWRASAKSNLIRRSSQFSLHCIHLYFMLSKLLKYLRKQWGVYNEVA